MNTSATPTAGTPRATRHRWIPLAAAVAYVVLVGAGLFVVPSAPGVHASGSELVAFYRTHASGVRALVALGAWSTVPIVILFAFVRTRLRGPARDVMLLGAAAVIVPTIVWTWISAGLALHAGTLDAGTARTVADVGAYFGPVLTVAILLLVVPVGIAAWHRRGGLPRWLAYATAAFAVEQAIESVTVFGTHGFLAAGGTMNFEVGAPLYLAWVLAVGVACSISPRAERA